MSNLIDDQGRRLTRLSGGPYRSSPDPPAPSCPSCGRPLDTGPTRTGLVGVCPRPACPEWVVIFTRAEAGGALVVAERIRRTDPPASQAAHAEAVRTAAG